MDKTMSQVMEDTAQVIIDNGHSKFTLFSEESGGYCVMGAFNKQDHGDAYWDHVPWRGDEASRIEIFAQALGFSDAGRAVEWNNHPNTTGEQVINRLIEVAKTLRNEGK